MFILTVASKWCWYIESIYLQLLLLYTPVNLLDNLASLNYTASQTIPLMLCNLAVMMVWGIDMHPFVLANIQNYFYVKLLLISHLFSFFLTFEMEVSYAEILKHFYCYLYYFEYNLLDSPQGFRVLWMCLYLIICVWWLSLSSYEVIKNKHNKVGEIFRSVKMMKRSKLYVSILLMRRTIFVIFLITLQSIQSWILVIMLGVVQIWYLIYIIILRPFEEKRNNVIEILNEIFFSILLNSLIFLNSENLWNSTLQNSKWPIWNWMH